MQSGVGKPAIMILGTYHVGNPGLDAHNLQADDVLLPKRQAEIRDCLDRLSRFKPTRVAVEVDAAKQEALQQQYEDYVAGKLSLGRSESHQLGFRLAQEMGLPAVDAVDWNKPVGGVGLGDVFEWAKEHKPALYQQVMDAGNALISEGQKALSRYTVSELLVRHSDPTAAQRDHAQYMAIARMAAGDNYIGIEWLKWWYQRNLIIFTNLSRLVTSPQERILVIYGAGHVHLLRQYVGESDMFVLEEVSNYLS